jgi:hypothetical protein
LSVIEMALCKGTRYAPFGDNIPGLLQGGATDVTDDHPNMTVVGPQAANAALHQPPDQPRLHGRRLKDKKAVALMRFAATQSPATRVAILQAVYGLSIRYLRLLPSARDVGNESDETLLERHHRAVAASSKISMAQRDRVQCGVKLPVIGRPDRGSLGGSGERDWAEELDCTIFFSLKFNHMHGLQHWSDLDIRVNKVGREVIELLRFLESLASAALCLPSRIDIASIPITAVVSAVAGISKEGFALALKKARDVPLGATGNNNHHDFNEPSCHQLFERMMKAAVILVTLADTVEVPPHGQCAFSFFHPIKSRKRHFRVYAWPILLPKLEPLDVSIDHLAFVAAHHPFFADPALFLENDKLRRVYTRSELTHLCSVVDISEDRTSLASRTPPEKRGYFRGRLGPTLNPSAAHGYFKGYAAWLRTTYSVDLLPRAATPAVAATHLPVATPEDDPLAPAFDLLCGSEDFEELVGGQSVAFRAWLLDSEAKTKLTPSKIELDEFMGMALLDQYQLALCFAGSRLPNELNPC